MKICVFSVTEKRPQTDLCIARGLSELGYGSADVLREVSGKPYLQPPVCHISVTHSDGVLLVAYNDSPVGIDMESEGKSVKNRIAIAGKYYSDAERELIDSSDEPEREFIRIWVKKEAYLKFTGEGMGGLGHSDTTILPGVFTELQIEGFIACTYTENNPDDIEIIYISGEKYAES